jgi:hypothetical protein
MRETLETQHGGVPDELGRPRDDRGADGRERDKDDNGDQPDGAASDQERGLLIPSIPR